MRVLVFGDSITQGYWDTHGGWVERLRNHYDSLHVQTIQTDDESIIFNLGVSADNSTNIVRRIEAETKARTRYNSLPIVVIQIGINDSLNSNSPNEVGVDIPIEQYEHNLRAIIEKVKSLSSRIIFVGLSACDESRTTPVFWGNFVYTNESIKQYENCMKNIAATRNIPFIPVFDKFLAEVKTNKGLLADGLHPSDEGHRILFEIVKPQLLLLLEAV